MVKIDRFWSFYLVWSEHTIHIHHWNRLDKLIPIIYEKLSVNTDNSGRTCFKLREMLCKSTYQIRRNEVPNSNLISQSSLKKVKINSCIQIYNKLDLIKVIKKLKAINSSKEVKFKRFRAEQMDFKPKNYFKFKFFTKYCKLLSYATT